MCWVFKNILVFIFIISAEINRRRLRPAMPNGTLIDRVTVTSSVTDVYTVTLQPFDCGNQFPLFELTNGDVSHFICINVSSEIFILLLFRFFFLFSNYH